MAKKKFFSLSQSVSQGLTETMNAVSNSYRYELIALSRIETDPDNPRELEITPNDIIKGISVSDINFAKKQSELENLATLADTIKKNGIINPVVVYKYLDTYRLVAGERRYLASILAGKEDIQARILSERPKTLDLRLIQWMENNEREELSLKDRISNVRVIMEEYKKQNPDETVTPSTIKELICISLSQATCYSAVLSAPKDINDLILAGKISNLDKAALLAKIESKSIREKATASFLNGGTIKDIKLLIKSDEAKQTSNLKLASKQRRGRITTRINLGVTKNVNVVKNIITAVVSHDKYKKYEGIFSDIDWNHYESTSKAFKKLIEILEKSLG